MKLGKVTLLNSAEAVSELSESEDYDETNASKTPHMSKMMS